jgi:hypothetical protein
VGAAIAAGALAFAAGHLFDAVGIYVAPAGFFLPVMQRVISSKLVYWLVPDGGAPAGLLLILVIAIMFWSIVFGATYFAWATLRRDRTAQGTTTTNS